MKKFIIGVLASLAISRTFKRELLLVIYKVYVEVNKEFNILPEISLEALRRTNKKMMDNKDFLAKSLVNDHRGNFRKFFEELYKLELMNYLGERKSSARDYPTVVNQFISDGPKPGPDPSTEASAVKSSKDVSSQTMKNPIDGRTMVNKFTPGEGNAVFLEPKDSIAQQAINFVNKQAEKTGKPPITEADVVKMSERLAKRQGMTEQ